MRAVRYAVERRRVESALAQLQAEQAARAAAERAQLALRASEERYRTLVTFLPLAILVEADGRLVYLNPAASDLLGATQMAELLGRSTLDLVHPDDRQAWREGLARAAAGSPVGAAEARFVRPDGNAVAAEVFTLPLEFEGQPATLSVIRDVNCA